MKREKSIMAEYKDVIVTAGSGGFGGPLKLHPDAKQNKIVNITGGVISPVAKRLAEMTGNRLLIRYLTETVSRCSLVMTIYGRPHSVDCGIDEHRQIIEALIADDGDRAADLMDAHIGNVASRALLEARKSETLQEVLASYASGPGQS